MEELGLDYVAGKLPPWFYRLWLSVQTVPLNKTADRQAIRPLGIRHPLARLFHKEVMLQSKSEVQEFLEPQQLGQSRAGGAKLVHSVRGMLELNPDWVCLGADIMNCYNEQNRGAVLGVLESPEAQVLRHLVTFAATILAPCPALEAGGRVWGYCTERRPDTRGSGKWPTPGGGTPTVTGSSGQ